MTTRADLLAHLDDLERADTPATCRTVPIAQQGIWTSDNRADQHRAAELCQGCPALVACGEYGITHPDEVGVYAGLTESQRRGAKTKENAHG